MIFSWFLSIYFYVLSYPEMIKEVEKRTKFICEIILNDEGFFDSEVYDRFNAQHLKRLYNLAFFGAKYIAWESIKHKNWQEFSYQELYKKNGICDRINRFALDKPENIFNNEKMVKIFNNKGGIQ